MFYAEWHEYGNDTISAGDTLMRFCTREERDEMVERLNGIHDEDVCAVVTTREVAHRYDVRDFGDADKRDEVQGVRTCAGRCFWEIGHRPNYIA